MRSTTPTHRVEFHSTGNYNAPIGWNTRQNGKANGSNLFAWVRALEVSTAPGGINAHAGPIVITDARIVDQRTGDVVAEYVAPNAVPVVSVFVMSRGAA
jgi:hypothetical protein